MCGRETDRERGKARPYFKIAFDGLLGKKINVPINVNKQQ